MISLGYKYVCFILHLIKTFVIHDVHSRYIQQKIERTTKQTTEKFENFNTNTSFTCTNLAKPEPSGDPLYRAMEAPFNSEAYTSQGPIIHPRLVGQATTSPFWMSMWHHASAAALKGVAWVHGIAFGSPKPRIKTN